MIRKFKQQHLVTRQVVKSENVHILTDKIIVLGSFFPPSWQSGYLNIKGFKISNFRSSYP
jgi:hypothetical protein